MKKIFVLCILVLTALPVFAQLSIGGYATSYWIPYRLTVFDKGMYPDLEKNMLHTTAVQTPWGEPDISAGVNFDAHSEWGGFHLGIGVANGKANRAAHAYSATGGGWVWVKPLGFIPVMESFTIYLGNPTNNRLMGRVGTSNLSTYVLNNSYSVDRLLAENGLIPSNAEREFRLEVQNMEYNTFTPFNPYSWGNANADTQNLWWPRIAAAAMVTWEPIDNLFIGAFVAPEMLKLNDWNADSAGINNPILDGINGPAISDDDINQDFYSAKQVYRKIQAGISYNIPGVGFARVQFIGVRNVIEAAFQITALGDLTLDLGFKFPFEGTDEEDPSTYKKKRDFVASLSANYRYYDFRVSGRVDAAFMGSDSSRIGQDVRVRGLNLLAYLVPSYQLGVGTVGLDLGFEYEQADDFNLWEKNSMMAGAGLWFARNMGNANFKCAVVSRFPLEWNGVKQPVDFFIPIVLEVGF